MRKVLLGFTATVLLTMNLGAQIHPTDPKVAAPPGVQRAAGNPGSTPANNPSLAELKQTYARLATMMRVTKTGEFKNSMALEPPEFAALKLQKQAADAEAGQIMSASGGTPGAGVSTGMLRTGMNTAAAPAPPAQRSPGMLTPSNAMVCTTTAINTVNRVKSGVIFTTDRNTNLYTITGCGFGNAQGKLYLEGGMGSFPGHAGKLAFVIRSWNDRGIVAMLDPSITGELDQNNVRLVVEPVNPTRAIGALQSGGHKFIAARGQPIPIPAFPKDAFCSTPASAMNQWCPAAFAIGGVVIAPCGEFGLTDCSIEVFRQHPFVHPDQPWIDHYTPKLKPGFVISSVQIQVATFKPDETMDIRTVNPTVNATQVFIRVPISSEANASNNYDSLYGVKFFAVGPVGISNPLADTQ